MDKIKVMSIFGTRPEAIKMAPLALELGKNENIISQVCVTAQHRQMLDSVMECFNLKADYDLDIMGKNQTLTDVTTKVLSGLKELLQEAKPDLILVHGDTTTTFSAALAAFYAKIPVGHVEAGLRTFDMYSPYPEEMNRNLVSKIATLHFAPTHKNAENLNNENVTDNVFITGNTVIDAMKYTIRNSNSFDSQELNEIDIENKKLIVLTCHRRENYGKPMENIFRAVKNIAENNSDVVFVYPVHLSPVVRDCANKILSGIENVKLIEPLDAMDMHKLMSKSYMVMTDSGGIQEEAPALGKPVLVLRKETERPEAVAAGTVRLTGTEYDDVVSDANLLLKDQEVYDKMAKAVNPYGDGNACQRIISAILYWAQMSSEVPQEFNPEG